MMTKLSKLPWLNIVIWAILIHVILIVLSILEVVLYSTLIHPGEEQVFYEQHAQQTAPYISIIFGIILFFFISRRLGRKNFDKRLAIGLALPLVYIILDVLIMSLSGTDWGQHYLTFGISFVTKIAASYLGVVTLKQAAV